MPTPNPSDESLFGNSALRLRRVYPLMLDELQVAVIQNSLNKLLTANQAILRQDGEKLAPAIRRMRQNNVAALKDVREAISFQVQQHDQLSQKPSEPPAGGTVRGSDETHQPRG